MKPSEALQALNEAGFSDQRIATALTERGVNATQPTIYRIRNGDIDDPKWKLGQAILALRAEFCPPRGRLHHKEKPASRRAA